MSFWDSNSRFKEYKKLTEPVYAVPKSVQQAIPISKISKSGIFEIERKLIGNKMYDRVYEFSDVNYTSKDHEEKTRVLEMLMELFQSLNVSFKMIIANHKRDLDRFEDEISYDNAQYPDLTQANNELIHEKIQNGKIHIEQRRYLVVTCYKPDFAAATTYFNTLDTIIAPIFSRMQSDFRPLNAEERLRCLHSMYRIGKEAEFDWTWEDFKKKRNWRNEICNTSMEVMDDHCAMRMDDHYVSVLYGKTYPRSLDEGKVMSLLTQGINFHTITTIDVTPMQQEVVRDKLETALVNNESAITREQMAKNDQGAFSSQISRPKRIKTESIEADLDLLDSNDETGFMMGFLIAVYGNTTKELEEHVEIIKSTGSQLSITFEEYAYQQLDAFHTCMPVGARRVDNMRCMLTSSLIAFQPFFAHDQIDVGGYVYGVNRKTKNIIRIDRKTLKNSNLYISGKTGSGKSMITKLEMGQIIVGSRDDIFIIDPQGEYADFIQMVSGQYIDFASGSQTYFNPFEIPDELLNSDDLAVRAEYIGAQSEFAASILKDIIYPKEFDGNHMALTNRVTMEMYINVFKQPKRQRSSPTMSDFRALMEQQPEAEARDLYLPLEAFTEGSLDMFNHASNIDIRSRIVGFGTNKLPDSLRKISMQIIIHTLTQRMEYNREIRRAVNFIVDEAQEVYKDEMGARILDHAFRTFRKKGGICTMITQNTSSANMIPQTRDMISNCELKIFLDQGGADRNVIAGLVDLSAEEIKQLSQSEVGCGVMVIGKKTILFDATIPRDSYLYKLYTTNFHEKSQNQAG